MMVADVPTREEEEEEEAIARNSPRNHGNLGLPEKREDHKKVHYLRLHVGRHCTHWEDLP